MNLKAIIFFVFLFSSLGASAQKSHLEVAAGAEFGWWKHQLGSKELGVTKTHHIPAPFIALNWLWPIKKWTLGPTLQGNILLKDDMRGPIDSRNRAQRIPIAKDDGGVPMIRYGIHLEYRLLRRGDYSFVPAFRYGGIQWSTLHPERKNFGYHQFREIVFQHFWQRKKNIILLRMTYDTQRIFLKEKANAQEQHHLYFWGTSLGVRF